MIPERRLLHNASLIAYYDKLVFFAPGIERKLSFRAQKIPSVVCLGWFWQRGRDWLRLSPLRSGSNPRVLIPKPQNEKGPA
jgi:hypothetical protein